MDFLGIELRCDRFTLDIHGRKRFLESSKHEVSAIPSIERAIPKLYAFTLEQARNKIQEAETVIQYRTLKPGRATELKLDKITLVRHYDRLL